MDKQISRRQHYVPKFLLDRFSDNGLVWCSDKRNSMSYRASTSNLFFARDYYELPGLDPNQIEKALSDIEGVAASILKKLDRGDTLDTIAHEERIDFSIFLASLMFRTPFFESAIADGEPIQPAEQGQVNQRIKQLQIASILDVNWPFFIYSLKWNVIENNTPTEFMLSDCPILRFRLTPTPMIGKGENAHPAPGALNILDRNVCLLLPIDPRKALVLTRGQTISNRVTEELVFRVDYEVNRVSERFFVSRIKPTTFKPPNLQEP